MKELYQSINSRLDLLQQKYKRVVNKWFAIKYPDLYKDILTATKFLHDSASIHERIFYIRNNIMEQQLCEVCKINPVLYNRSTHKLSHCCSNLCNNKSEHKKNSTKTTCLKKFGVENPFQNEKCKLKSKNTKLQRYRNENYTNIEQMKQTKATLEWKKQNRYKYSDMWKKKTPKEMKHKALAQKRTKKQKYGDENYVNADKSKLTRREKYSNENYNNIKKIQETCIKKYGVPSYLLLTHTTAISKLNKRIFKILNKHHIYFKSEFRIGIKSYDIKFQNNILLEINGDFWHANPKIYKANDILNMPKGLRKASDIWKYDKLKKKLAEQHGYKVVYIWESEMKKLSNDKLYDLIKNRCMICLK